MTLAEGQGSIAPAFGHGDNRGALSRQAAQLLLDHVTGHAGSVVFLRADGLREDPAVLRLALSALAAALGGRPFLPASDSMDRIMTFVRGGMPGRMTVARTVLDLRRDGLYLTRENRDLPVVHMSAGENVIWDNRYDVTNRSGETIIARGSVEAMSLDAQRRFPGVPKGVALWAMRSDLMVSKANGVLDAPLSSIAVTRVVAPFDLFLSRFDLELACAVAELLGRSAYPQPPV
jgi:tRNA(Ile)-lysidine synthase